MLVLPHYLNLIISQRMIHGSLMFGTINTCCVSDSKLLPRYRRLRWLCELPSPQHLQSAARALHHQVSLLYSGT